MNLFKRYKTIKIVVLFVSALCCINNGFAQSNGTNHVRIRIPKIPVIDTVALDTIPIQRQGVHVIYDDPLGRKLQIVQMQASANLMDYIKPFSYDNMGRQSTIYLPYADELTNTSTKGSLRSSAVNDVLNFYNTTSPGASKIATDPMPYAQSIYEPSPLGRVMEQGDVGTVFQPGSGHTVTAYYGVNSDLDGINYYTVNEGSSVLTTSYFLGVLEKDIVKDQNGHRMAIWKDMQGKIVTKTALDAPNQYYSTDYVYNDLEQLSFMITPSVKKNLTVNGIASLSFINHYDSVGRVIEKKMPNKGWVYTIYNRGDQPVLVQDSNLRAKKQWLFMKYDADGSVVESGIYTNKTIISRKAMQTFCDSFPVLWEDWQPGIGYTNNAFPQQNAIPGASSLLYNAIYYYNDYTFQEAAGKAFQTNIYNNTPTMRTMGMVTGMSVYVLGTMNQRLVTVNYYDKQNRLIQQIGDNHLGQVDVVNNKYNFLGKLINTQRVITPNAGNSVTIKDRYVYDQSERLLDTYESLNGGSEIDISHNVYNEIGQKVSEGLHSTNYNGSGNQAATSATITEDQPLNVGKTDIAGQVVYLNPGFSFTPSPGNSFTAAIGYSFAQTQEFRYSIRGELTNINNGTLTFDNGFTQSDPNALFGESITYSESSPLGAQPQYNGNISGITWRNKIEQSGLPNVTTGGQGYAFNYDNVNRLTQSNYYTQNGNSFTQSNIGAFSENVSSYDEMGNIQALKRNDKSGNTINNLTYAYQAQSNQLQSVGDAGSQNISGTFTYDGNGNMVSDSRKGIAITYNYLDLPDTVKQGGNKLVFTYDATGNKLYKQLINASGNVLSQRHYIEDAELTASSSVAYDGQVESIAMAEGRIVNAGSGHYQYEYYLQDHLFNNRVTFRPKNDGTLDLIVVQNYYPFGSDMGDGTMNYSLSPPNLHKYNGKEWQPELTLSTYDFGARHYDPVIGRWTSVDPRADELENFSPYNYVNNNPINLIDPDGMQPYTGSGLPMLEGTPNNFGSFGDWGGVVVNGVTGFLQASSAFSINKPITTQNWTNNMSNVQQNVFTANINPFGNSPTWQAVLNAQPSTNVVAQHVVYKSGSMNYLTNMHTYYGQVYDFGGTGVGNTNSKTGQPSIGIDCSFFVGLSFGYKGRWTTSLTVPKQWGLTGVKVPNTSHSDFINSLKKGDLLLWRGKHAAFYLGNSTMAHAHGKQGKGLSGESQDLEWFLTNDGYPEVLRK